jgi:hypothetical protein
MSVAIDVNVRRFTQVVAYEVYAVRSDAGNRRHRSVRL